MNGSSASAPPAAAAGAPVIVCGLGHVGIRVVELLARLGERAVVITRDTRPEWRRVAETAGATVVTGDARDPGLLRASASGLAWTKRALA